MRLSFASSGKCLTIKHKVPLAKPWKENVLFYRWFGSQMGKKHVPFLHGASIWINNECDLNVARYGKTLEKLFSEKIFFILCAA